MTKKLNDVVFQYFAPIPKKQWKQKIQFQLKGADYQKELINQIAEGVSTLPFYTNTDLEKVLDYTFNIETKKTVCIEVLDEQKSNLEALEYVKNGAITIYFICFSKEIDVEKLIKNISIPIVINCQFLDLSFAKKIENNEHVKIFFDPIGKLSTTGNWYRNQEHDFGKTNEILSLNNTQLSINLSLFENAGADYIQQLAYSVCQLKNYAESINLSVKKCITYTISVSTEVYHEIAKLKALRILHEAFAEKFSVNTKCHILLVKSKRNIRATDHQFNKLVLQTEQLIGFAGQADFVCGMSASNYFTDIDLKEQDLEINDFLNSSFHEEGDLYSNSVFIEKLTQQFIEKSISLINNIEEGNGYLIQFKKGIIQQKIFDKALKQQKKYNEHFKNVVTAQFLEGKKAIQYPFFTNEEKNTQYKPIIKKRLHAPLEKPVWDQFFSNE